MARILAAACLAAMANAQIAITTPAIPTNSSRSCRSCVAAADRAVEILETLRRRVKLNRGEPEVQHALDWLCEDVPEQMAHEGLAAVDAHLAGRGLSRDDCHGAVERVDDALERALLAEGARDDLGLATTSMLQVRHGACHGRKAPCGDVFEVNCPACHLDGAVGRRSLPARHTCDGDGLSPALEWAGAPPGTRSFALSLRQIRGPDDDTPLLPEEEEEDEDADGGGGLSMRHMRFDHLWFGWDVPGAARGWAAAQPLPAAAPHAPTPSFWDRDEAVQQITTRVETYSPPCIPSGTNGAFRFEVLALGAPPPLAVAPAPPRKKKRRAAAPAVATFDDFARDARRHVLATAHIDVFIHAPAAVDDEGEL